MVVCEKNSLRWRRGTSLKAANIGEINLSELVLSLVCHTVSVCVCMHLLCVPICCTGEWLNLQHVFPLN